MESANDYKYILAGSLLEFTRTFYKLRNNREFKLSLPIGRESHYITICRALTKVFDGETKRLIINIPPRYGKTELVIHFVAWSMGIFPDSNFLYVSYGHGLAKKQTQIIREIITRKEYQEVFNVRLKDDTQAKDNFETSKNGSVYAVGARGGITGRGAGIKECNRFGGAIIIDDIHKPDEASSDTIREGVIDWYYNSLQSRTNSPSTPIIIIGQRVHEEDLSSELQKDPEWERVILPAIDECGNALDNESHTIQTLRKMQEKMPYHFASQYQQNPQPAGGGIFKPEWFKLFEFEPQIISTFITCDTAETVKTYNDATVFSFWGLYSIKHGEIETDLYGLHWIECREVRVEPKDLYNEFMAFYFDCMRHTVKPKLAIVEKKSTGVTLSSSLKSLQGLTIRDIERTKASGSKTTRFLEMQPFIASQLISLPLNAHHTKPVLEHMRKITANDTHAHDDICDTCYDAIKFALIDKSLLSVSGVKGYDPRPAVLGAKQRELNRIRGIHQPITWPDRSPFG